MSTGEIRVGKTIDEAIKFAFSNLLSIIKVGWLPIALTFGIIAAFAWVFWQPLILAYIDFFNAVSIAADPEELEPFLEGLEQAIEQVGWGRLVLGYAVLLVVGFVGFAIPMTAYCRMMVLGERYGGSFYLRLGPHEINLALAYLAITMIVTLAIMVIGLASGTLLAVVAGPLGDGAGAAAGLFFLLYMITIIVVICWLFGRLALSLPASAVDGGIPIARAWELSKGLGRTLAWIVVLGYLLVMVFSTIAAMVLSLIAGLMSAVLTMLGSQMVPMFTGVVWVIGYIALYCLSTAFFMALFAGPYKRLTERAP